MIGGDTAAVLRLDPIFKTIAPGEGSVEATPGRAPGSQASQGYLHCGPSGAGHFVKMVHNGIEYGMMAAIAEGLSIIKGADIGNQKNAVHDAENTPLRDPEYYQYDINVGDVAEVWRRGSVISSWLIDLTAAALAKSPDLERVRRPGVRLRRGPVDGGGRDRRGRARPGHHRGAVPAVRVARPRRVHRQDPLRDAVGVRRPRGAEATDDARTGRQLGHSPRQRAREARSACDRAVRRDRGPGQAEAAAGALPPVRRRAAAGQVRAHRHLAAGVRGLRGRLQEARAVGVRLSSGWPSPRASRGRSSSRT